MIPTKTTKEISRIYGLGNYQSNEERYNGEEKWVSVDVLRQKLQEATELLKEVVEKRGAYSQNHLVHAENVINNASEKASKVTVILSELLVGLEPEEAKK